jgi:hypothetical protein
MEKEFAIKTSEKRADRKDLVSIAKSQVGVNALKGKFNREQKSIHH